MHAHMQFADCLYRSIPGKRPWALNPSKLNWGGVGAYPGEWALTVANTNVGVVT